MSMLSRCQPGVASIHNNDKGFSHIVFGTRTGFGFPVWEGKRVAIAAAGVYVFRAHDSVNLPKLDLTALVIYEHSFAVGPRVRLRLHDRVGLSAGLNFGVSVYAHLLEPSSGDVSSDTVYASTYYDGGKFYGEGVLGLLLASDALSLNLLLSGTAIGREERRLGFGLGGYIGVDVIRVAILAQRGS